MELVTKKLNFRVCVKPKHSIFLDFHPFLKYQLYFDVISRMVDPSNIVFMGNVLNYKYVVELLTPDLANYFLATFPYLEIDNARVYTHPFNALGIGCRFHKGSVEIIATYDVTEYVPRGILNNYNFGEMPMSQEPDQTQLQPINIIECDIKPDMYSPMDQCNIGDDKMGIPCNVGMPFDFRRPDRAQLLDQASTSNASVYNQQTRTPPRNIVNGRNFQYFDYKELTRKNIPERMPYRPRSSRGYVNPYYLMNRNQLPFINYRRSISRLAVPGNSHIRF